jgi:hypothetical protein
MVIMKRYLLLLGSLATVALTLGLASTLSSFSAAAREQQPLRIYIRSGPKSHAPGAHDYPRFLKEWVPLLNERGAKATGGDTFPTREQLAETDVVILHKQEAGNIDEPDRKNLNEYLARGGGLVVIHAGLVSRDPDWFKTIVGGNGSGRCAAARSRRIGDRSRGTAFRRCIGAAGAARRDP